MEWMFIENEEAPNYVWEIYSSGICNLTGLEKEETAGIIWPQYILEWKLAVSENGGEAELVRQALSGSATTRG